jgi:hypothetical protein
VRRDREIAAGLENPPQSLEKLTKLGPFGTIAKQIRERKGKPAKKAGNMRIFLQGCAKSCLECGFFHTEELVLGTER